MPLFNPWLAGKQGNCRGWAFKRSPGGQSGSAPPLCPQLLSGQARGASATTGLQMRGNRGDFQEGKDATLLSYFWPLTAFVIPTCWYFLCDLCSGVPSSLPRSPLSGGVRPEIMAWGSDLHVSVESCVRRYLSLCPPSQARACRQELRKIQPVSIKINFYRIKAKILQNQAFSRPPRMVHSRLP